MAKRRKFLAGLGALASGSAAAVGTGALSSQTLSDRQVTAQVTADSGGMIGLEAGDLPSVSGTDSGSLQIDLSGDDGEGINIDSTYTWGDHDNPSESYAFKLTNNDERDFETVEFEYDLTEKSWVTISQKLESDQSHLTFTAYNIGGSAQTYMDAPEYGLDTSDGPRTRDFLKPHRPRHYFRSGDVWYVVVDADTTGADAGTEDNLSGELSISVSDPLE